MLVSDLKNRQPHNHKRTKAYTQFQYRLPPLKLANVFVLRVSEPGEYCTQWPPGRRWQIYVVLPPSQPPGRSGLCPRNDHLPAQISALATGVARSLRVHCYLGFQGNSLRLFPVWMGQVGYKAIQHPVMDGHDLQVKVSRTLVSSQAKQLMGNNLFQDMISSNK